MSVLPEELVEVIIDFLKDDKESLRSCFLSARCFVERARIHIFHDIVISSHRRLKMLLVLFGVSPSLPSTIHTIKFSGQTFIDPADWIFTDNTTRCVFQSLSNVEEVFIENVRIPRLSDNVSPSSIFPFQQHIRRLGLDDLILENGDDLFTLLCAFPSVKYLNFGFVLFQNPQSTMATFPSPPQELRLETLELQFSYNINHSAMLFLREHFADILSVLKHLRVTYMTSHELQLVRLILSQTRGSLITMYIGPMILGNAESQQHANDPILLLSLSHIEYLTIVLDETDPHISPLKYWTENFATDDEDFKLRELTINLKVHVEQSDSAFSASFPLAAQWSALEAALCRSQMKNLCRVNLNLTADSGSGYDPQWMTLFARLKGIIEENCQLLMSRHILRVGKSLSFTPDVDLTTIC
ncbi:uncharacterized protein EV420DRAFT_1769447 [Desarmillaria tabescens]|uniref:Uncharacterized protein n=1 Tax=Armillaria tabescens TaxID=1929756 RepID=A0AA39MN18_ARMTA|nr:uncharacterized protein EV420DRAFT_1769447 [Desarmillaria tabescens]KAK0439460.1 hypothetical protein EV420DRAFT_1769447 [Desarmillaria tabescens]